MTSCPERLIRVAFLPQWALPGRIARTMTLSVAVTKAQAEGGHVRALWTITQTHRRRTVRLCPLSLGAPKDLTRTIHQQRVDRLLTGQCKRLAEGMLVEVERDCRGAPPGRRCQPAWLHPTTSALGERYGRSSVVRKT